ncbi:hypothetical protein M2360_004533 [Rhizobium sp. SG_E_25_P2]|uniref:hypothetical protein n=1 Tax=Rhizobium sp. SG_E_25_P2 TaxID=2879942 RepID=UPI0024745F23|nr:hypothetical protein [Rhizobium sp. SG_E_25_P2]MDH6269107.1 hypothetical protein [Rhizobium sp. SG_E_25_P2]
MIAAKVGYPTSLDDPFATGGMVRLNRRQAAHVLAVAASTSLAYDRPCPARSEVDAAAEAIGELADDAAFFGNGLWDPAALSSWTPLTAATFDCGLIGYDAEQAFIFWVEEED